MKIGIDISQIVYEGTGTGTYFKNLASWLPKIDHKNEYVFFGSSLRRRQPGFWPFPPTFLDFVWNRLHILPIENLIGNIDVFHSSDWTQPPAKAKKVATILDMIIYKFPQSSHPQIIATQKRRLKWVKKEADRVITISQSAKNDIVEILGIPANKITVIYLAANPEFTPQSKEKIAAVRKKYGLQKDYFLTVGTLEPRKNLQRVIEAFHKVNINNCDLALAGKTGWGDENFKFKISNLKLLGYIPQEDMPALYSGAKCFLYASLYEGFGIPVLEALACNCPVITSKTGSLPEVGENAVTYVDPLSVEDIAQKMATVKKTGKEIAQAKKFSWEKTTRETLKVYEELV